MLRLVLAFVTCFSLLSPLVAQDCASVAAQMKLPKKIKTRGKPKVVKWEDVDKVLAELTERLQGSQCSLTFAQVFNPKGKEEELNFPLTNNLIRIAPENTFEGLPVKTKEGDLLGPYLGRARYERSGGLYASGGYSLYYFQYQREGGQPQSVGNRLLLGDFTVPWAGLKDKVLVDFRE
ncbi:MAG: hypothetical protein JSU96_02275 [Acidobacteriota bacterium]|nr:MAG: hypothetical protein JSU96_02275 [Acidobacteriota bacterium]